MCACVCVSCVNSISAMRALFRLLRTLLLLISQSLNNLIKHLARSHWCRLWTRGYDTYTPTKNIVFHDYTPVPHKWFLDNGAMSGGAATQEMEREKQAAQDRLRAMWRMPGHKRTSYVTRRCEFVVKHTLCVSLWHWRCFVVFFGDFICSMARAHIISLACVWLQRK